jgi:AcrR family transcriptional regulator
MLAAMSVVDRRNSRPAPTLRSVAERLDEALAVFGTSAPGGAPHERATVAALCRRAGVSRNTLYRYHPEVLAEVRRLHRQQLHASAAKPSTVSRDLRHELRFLQAQLTKLAALIDHYYAAYREAQVLLERRDREFAELRRSIKSPIQLRR